MSTHLHYGRGWADVHLTNLVANARAILAAVPGSKLLPMVKADAYGLGMVPVARALRAVDLWGYGVATIDEAQTLRDAGFTEPILVFTPAFPEDLPRYRALDARAALDHPRSAAVWDIPFHLGVDTGMARCGVRWDDAGTLRACASPHLEGVFTHLHSADEDPASVPVQWERFEAARAVLGVRPALVHVANSAGAWRLGASLDLVRPGVFLYGGSVGADLPAPDPVVALRAPVVSLRTLQAGETVSYGGDWAAGAAATIATIGIGYGDGVPRAVQGKAHVILHGVRCPVVGRVTMDFLMADVSAVPGVALGDIATLIGADGGARITLDAFAAWAGTISYEIIARLGPRLARRYTGP